MPLIGVTAHGAVNDREKFGGCKSNTVAYKDPPKASIDGAPISPHHSHFLFIDAGKENRKAWGSEIIVRAELEKFMTISKAVPLVLLVVQGGPGTLATVLATAKLNCPIVILSNSGGAATAVWRFCETGELDPEKDKPFLNKKEQLDEIKALQDESEGILLSFFNVGADAMNTVILKAIVNNLTTDSAARKTAELRGDDPDDGPDTVSKALLLTVRWDKPQIAKQVLKYLADQEPGQFTSAHQRGIQCALALERVEVLELLMAASAFETHGLPQISMAALYLLSLLAVWIEDFPRSPSKSVTACESTIRKASRGGGRSCTDGCDSGSPPG